MIYNFNIKNDSKLVLFLKESIPRLKSIKYNDITGKTVTLLQK